MTGVLADAAGWAGAVGLLAAYALLSTGRLTERGRLFQVLNLLGAAGLLMNGVYHGAWPSVGVNAVWLLIGALALLRAHHEPRCTTSSTGRRPRLADPRTPASSTR